MATLEPPSYTDYSGYTEVRLLYIGFQEYRLDLSGILGSSYLDFKDTIVPQATQFKDFFIQENIDNLSEQKGSSTRLQTINKTFYKKGLDLLLEPRNQAVVRLYHQMLAEKPNIPLKLTIKTAGFDDNQLSIFLKFYRTADNNKFLIPPRFIASGVYHNFSFFSMIRNGGENDNDRKFVAIPSITSVSNLLPLRIRQKFQSISGRTWMTTDKFGGRLCAFVQLLFDLVKDYPNNVSDLDLVEILLGNFRGDAYRHQDMLELKRSLYSIDIRSGAIEKI